MTKVVKFGGTSLAEAKQFLKVADIIRSDPDRRYVVPSAPGKRFSGDTKVTDMFYACYDSASRGGDFEEIFQKIKNRYNDIISGLGLDMSLEDDFEHIRLNFIGRAGRDYAASRGEYLNGKIVAKLLGFAFIDAADVIFFDESGKYDAKRTIPILRERLSYTEYAVIPGFYGSMPNDTIRTFSRGGSDITGSIVSAAADADVIVVCIGENSYCETPGNMNDLNLSQNQKKLVRELASTGKPLVLVLNEGRPRLIGDIEPLAQAVVDILLPGNYGGDALANLLAGDANFSARLPFTYPRWPDALATYDYKPCQKRGTMEGEYNYDAVMDVQWPFCHGLSYTTFEYGNLRANLTEFRAGDTLSFTVDISNTGDCAGKEAVLLWSSDLVASLTPDVIRLRNFEKISLEPGETRTVTLSIPASDLAFVGYDGRWRLEKGDFRIRMGTETLFVRCVETRVWDTPNIP